MNVPLLRRIQRQIDKAPERFQMENVSCERNCETAFCFAGWAIALTGGRIWGKTSREQAMDLLEITDKQMNRIFVMCAWPEQFQGPDDFSEEAAGRAIRRIGHFIATEGRE